MDVVEQEI